MYRPTLIRVIFHGCICHWHRESVSSMLREISVSSLTASNVSTGFSRVYYQLRQLRPLVRCLCENAAKILIQVFINTRLDYCNSFILRYDSRWFDEPPAVSSERRGRSHHRCQAVRAHYASPIICIGCQSADGWISTYPPSSIVRWLAGTAPVYLADECTVVTAAGRRPLWSADNQTCVVKRSRNQFDDRCFSTAGQRCGTVCLNSFGNWTSPSDSLNDR